MPGRCYISVRAGTEIPTRIGSIGRYPRRIPPIGCTVNYIKTISCNNLPYIEKGFAMKTKQLNCPLAVKAVADDGFFSGYASVFNVVDSQFDIIVPGAFSRSLRERKHGKGVKLLWQHHTDEPIGAFTTIREDANGLYVEGCLLLDVQRGMEAYALLKSGALEGLSIGYSAVSFHYDEQQGVRYLTEVDVWEISLVTFPANPEAGVTFVKEHNAVMEEVLQALDRAMEQLLVASR